MRLDYASPDLELYFPLATRSTSAFFLRHPTLILEITLTMNIMNGLNGHAAPAGLWQEARNSDGRVYYYNTITKATQWTKPEDLMTPAEARLQSLLCIFVC